MKILPVIFAILIAIFFFIVPVSPAEAKACPEGGNITKECYDAHMQSTFEWTNVLSGIVGCGIGGSPLLPENAQSQCLAYGDDGKLVAYTNMPGGGALAFVNRAIASTFDSPLSTNAYIAEVSKGFDPASPTYAQQDGINGSGVGIIRPVLQIWLVLRNFAYLLFILIFLAIGFMIMFRQKLNPQTVITVQSALPGLVIGLVLVTFSYFISALIIDLTYVGMWVVASVFTQAGANLVGDITKVVQEGNIFSLWGSFTLGGENKSALTNEVLEPMIQGTQVMMGIDPAIISQPLSIGSPFGVTAAKLLGITIGGIAGIIASAVIMIALFIQLARLLWSLVTSYITILVVVVLSPMIIMWSSIPGKSKTMEFWWRNILGNVLVFPAVFAGFLFAGLFLANTNPNDFKTTLPFFGGLPVGILKTLIGYGILLGTPAIPGMIKSMVGVKDLGAINKEAFIGAGLGAAAATPLGTGIVRSSANLLHNNLERAPQGSFRKGAAIRMQKWWGKQLGL